ncbi:MAG: hypothetical protein ACT4PE_08705 [Candidatus Eiseniibacteriota bacterium]
MIRLEIPRDPEVAYGLGILVDLSRLLRVAETEVGSAGPSVVRFELRDVPRAELIDQGTLIVQSGVVGIPIAAVRAAARIAGAAAEQGSLARDRHGRVPSQENELVKAGIEGQTVLARWARDLRLAAGRAVPGVSLWCVPPWPEGRRWAAAITHDLDVVTGWPALTVLRVAELVKGKHIRLAARALDAGMRALFSAPVHATVDHLLHVEGSAGAVATWFILCGDPDLGSMIAKDLTYRIDAKPVTHLLSRLREQGAEIGLHGSFATARDGAALRAQKERLQDAIEGSVRGVRQHFLRMRLPETLRDMESAGFDWDSTFGFPDRAGFRLGAGDVLRLWDARERTALRLDEVPFAWMDRSASKYSGVENPAEWLRAAHTSADTVRDSEGAWVGIWHPYLSDALGYPGASLAFEELVAWLSAKKPWFATMSQIVDWRRERRALRALPSGSAVPRVLGAFARRLCLESTSGETSVAQVEAFP